MRRRLIIALAVLAGLAAAGVLAARAARGTLALAPLVADGMVLQRETAVALTGRARPGWPVVVAGTWGAVALARAGDDGAWRAELRTRGAGGPYRVAVWAGDATVVGDVWIGETWLCAGQSNMAMTVAEARAPEALRAVPATPPLRLFTVPLAMSETPERTCGGAWQPATAETAAAFSAVCLAFGRALQDALAVPVGLVAAAVPGTEIELWTSERGLRTVPEIAVALDAAPPAETAAVETAWRPLDELGWLGPDDHPLADSVLSLRAGLAVPSELGGDRLLLDLPPALAHAAVRANGHALGPAGAETRVVPPDVLAATDALAVEADHTLVEPVAPADFDGVRVRAGERSIPLPPWEARLARPRADRRFAQHHSLVFNAMIAPLAPYALRGVVWYQGEANVRRAAQYAEVFPALIGDWRAWWGRELAFGFVQLPGYGGYRPTGAIAELRDAQRRTLAVPGTGMVVTIDLSDGADIHGADKAAIGARLGAWALADVYRRPGVVGSGPLFREWRAEPWGVRVRFDHADGGLVALYGRAAGFELAGEDGRYRPAPGVIDRDSVLLLTFGIRTPIAVRYAWADVPVPSLTNAAGLPASPFRSDDWRGVTSGVAWRARPGAP